MGQFQSLGDLSGQLVAEAALRFEQGGTYAAMRREVLQARLSAVIEGLHIIDAPGVIEVLDFWLAELRAGLPDAPQGDDVSRRDAAFWADTATPSEIEAYVAAGLAAIPRKLFAMGLLKRIMVNIWARLGPDDQRAFLARVDPNGAFRGRAA